MSKVIFHNDWQSLLGSEFEQDYYQALRRFLIDEYRSRVIFPDMHDIFNALHLTCYSDVKVVLLGQDPYHGRGQAHGLSFSVKRGVKVPPSLVNIFKELESDLGCKPASHGCLESWAREGVLLLNAVLTVREGEANSHRGKGWEKFTDRVIELVNEKRERVVFILWGRQAREKKSLIDLSRHSVIESVHPSPLSVHGGFFGSKPFSRANVYLEESGRKGVCWDLEEFV